MATYRDIGRPSTGNNPIYKNTGGGTTGGGNRNQLYLDFNDRQDIGLKKKLLLATIEKLGIPRHNPSLMRYRRPTLKGLYLGFQGRQRRERAVTPVRLWRHLRLALLRHHAQLQQRELQRPRPAETG